MTYGEMAGLAIGNILIQAGVQVAALTAVRPGPLRWLVHAVSGAAIALSVVGLLLYIQAGHGVAAPLAFPPVGLLAMLTIAIAGSSGILWLAGANGWLTNWAGRAGAGLLIYMILLIAFPPPSAAWQLGALVAGMGLAAVLFAVWWLSDGQQTGPYQAMVDFNFEEDDSEDIDEDDWIFEPVGAAAGAQPDSDRLRVVSAERTPDRRGGGEAGSGTSGERSLERTRTDSVPRFADSDSQGAGGDGEGKRVHSDPAVADPGRRGRGRRLAGALVAR